MISVFAALLLEDRILTRERLKIRHINCEEQCVMCDMDTLETLYHIFFQCFNATMLERSGHVLEIWCRAWAWYMILGRRQIFITAANKGTKKGSGLYYSWLFFDPSGGNTMKLFFKARIELPAQIVASRAEEDARLSLRFCKKRETCCIRNRREFRNRSIKQNKYGVI